MILRTPDERFTNLPGYTYAPHYAQLGDLRMVRSMKIIFALHLEPRFGTLPLDEIKRRRLLLAELEVRAGGLEHYARRS